MPISLCVRNTPNEQKDVQSGGTKEISCVRNNILRNISEEREGERKKHRFQQNAFRKKSQIIRELSA